MTDITPTTNFPGISSSHKERLHPDGLPVGTLVESLKRLDGKSSVQFANEQELRAREAEARVAELERELAERNVVARSRYNAVGLEVETLEATLEGVRLSAAQEIQRLEREIAWLRAGTFTLYEDSGGCRNYSAFDVDQHLLVSKPPADWNQEEPK